ncbi:MAG: sulfatase-like hydrolase/transferase [Gemmatimonadaceae bacterium]
MSLVERPNRLRDVWIVIACAALAGALAEFSWILGARIVLGRITLLNPQGIWLAPIANLLFMAPPILLVWALVRWRKPAWALPSAVALAAFMAALQPLLILRGRLHTGALLVLAGGVALQLALFARKRPSGAQRTMRWLAGGLAVVAALGGVAFNGLRFWRESQGIKALPAAQQGTPNVLLLVLDTVRALSLSVYGYARPTSPTLERLAARGVRFDRAVATAPWTLPTHSSLFTGRYAHEMTAAYDVPLDRKFPTLAERLTTLGYLTAGIAANTRYCSYEFGVTRGFGYYRDYDVSLPEMVRSSALSRVVAFWFLRRRGRYSVPGRLGAERMNERFLAWLDDEGRRTPERPFFAFINYFDAHDPYEPPAPYDTMFSGREPPTRISEAGAFTKEEVQGLRDSYDASIAYLDSKLGELFAALERRGLLENTVIIVTADHGEEFNEHGQMNHGNTLYFPGLHVPLIIAGGHVPHAMTAATPVTLADVPATILDLVRAPATTTLPGRSLAAHWRAGAESLGVLAEHASPIFGEVGYTRNLPASIPVSKGGMKSVVVDGHHYIRGPDGSEEMYDIRTDPWERANVLSAPGLHATLQRARALVDQAQARDVHVNDRPAAITR